MFWNLQIWSYKCGGVIDVVDFWTLGSGGIMDGWSHGCGGLLNVLVNVQDMMLLVWRWKQDQGVEIKGQNPACGRWMMMMSEDVVCFSCTGCGTVGQLFTFANHWGEGGMGVY